MATFVVLAKWTEKTMGALQDAPAAAEEMKKFVRDMGAQIKGWYLLMGQYDEMCILEASASGPTSCQGGRRASRPCQGRVRRHLACLPFKPPPIV
jgi:hypothetical protein